jgi:ribosomal protein L16 Arg81 hydroxylase
MLDYVADILGEHPELIEAIVSNDDNLTYGSIISVGLGPDQWRTALTDDAIDELRSMIADARRSPEEWDQFLQDFVSDPAIIDIVKTHSCGSNRAVTLRRRCRRSR